MLPLYTPRLYSVESRVSAFAARKWQQENAELDSSDDEPEADLPREISDPDGEPYSAELAGSYEEEPYDSGSEDGETRIRGLQRTLLSSWAPNKTDVLECTEDLVSIRLKPNEKVTFIGHYELSVKSGAVSINGAVLSTGSGSHHVFAPSTHALPQIMAMAPTVSQIQLRHSECSMRLLSRSCPVYRRIWNELGKQPISDLMSHPTKRSFSFVRATGVDDRGLYPLEIHESWTRFVEGLVHTTTKAPIVLVCGSKGAGKSTFCRFLANSMLNNMPKDDLTHPSAESNGIYWLDLDPGQPEFTPPGQISLIRVTKPILGPPFTHANPDPGSHYSLVRAHCIGATSPADDPGYFVSCAVDLQRHHESLQQGSSRDPLIINCPGWSRHGSFVLELMVQLVRSLPSTDNVCVGPAVASRGAATISAATGLTQLHKVPSTAAPESFISRSAAELREMQIISYFHSVGFEHSIPLWTTQLVSSREPVGLRFGGKAPDILGICTVPEHPPTPDFLFDILEKWVVGVCVMANDDEIADASSRVERTGAQGLPYWPPERPHQPVRPGIQQSQLVGWAYVVDISVTTQTLSLVSPISNLTWAKIRSKTKDGHPRISLIRGHTDPPKWVYLEPVRLEPRKGQENQGPPNTAQLGVHLDIADLPQHYDAGARDLSSLCGVAYIEKKRKNTGAGVKELTRRPGFSGKD